MTGAANQGAEPVEAQSRERTDEEGPAAREASPVHLSLGGIVKQYGSVTAVAGIDLEIRQGELLTILGPSGSGKTTMLKVIAGFEYPDAGTVVLGGREITFASPAARGIGMVFQNYALFPHMKVAQNVAFPLEMRGVARREAERRVAEALEMVGLKGYEERLPKQLSGGQQQRVALARAIVFDPGLLLLDEPFGALDRKLREQMQLEVKRLQRRLNLTAVFVTHDQEEALVLSDRIAVMSQGLIEQIGPPRDIYARPVNRFVADFIGESNLFRGRIERVLDERYLVALDAGPQVLTARDPAYAVGEEVGVMVRPEAPRPLADGEAADNGLAAEVAEVVYLGDVLKYELRCESGIGLTVRWPFNEAGETLDVGDRLRVGWSAERVHLVAWT